VGQSRSGTDEFIDDFGGALECKLVHFRGIAFGRLGGVALGRFGLGGGLRLRHGGALDLVPCTRVVRVHERLCLRSG
jgi:hypothetical protein